MEDPRMAALVAALTRIRDQGTNGPMWLHWRTIAANALDDHAASDAPMSSHKLPVSPYGTTFVEARLTAIAEAAAERALARKADTEIGESIAAEPEPMWDEFNRKWITFDPKGIRKANFPID